MCRLMGYVSKNETTFDSLVGVDFQEFVSLSSIHCDGWGVATINREEKVAHVDRAPETAVTSATFNKAIHETVSDGALLHLRWATAGLPISENNTHPFAYKDISFIHNGAVNPPAVLEPLISPKFLPLIQGETDSERYFYFMLTKIDELGLIEGARAAANYIRENLDYSSINAMVMNEDSYVVISEFNPSRKPEWAPNDYYELKYKKDDKGVLVASSGWSQPGWSELPNHSLMVIDRSTFDVKIQPL